MIPLELLGFFEFRILEKEISWRAFVGRKMVYNGYFQQIVLRR